MGQTFKEVSTNCMVFVTRSAKKLGPFSIFVLDKPKIPEI